MKRIDIVEITKDGILFRYKKKHLFRHFDYHVYFANTYLKDIFHFTYDRWSLFWKKPNIFMMVDEFLNEKLIPREFSYTRYRNDIIEKEPEDDIVKVTIEGVVLNDKSVVPLSKYKDYTLGQLFRISKGAIFTKGKEREERAFISNKNNSRPINKKKRFRKLKDHHG